MDSGCAMAGKRDLKRVRDGGGPQKTGNAAAAGGIGLQDIDGARFKHGAKVIGGIAIFAGSDDHAGGAAISQQSKACKIIARYRFFEPTDAQLTIDFGEFQRLFARICAVGVDHQLRVPDDGGSGLRTRQIVIRVSAYFHFDPTAALSCPPTQLLGKAAVVIGCEATAAVNGHLLARRAQERGQRQVQELGL